MQKITSFMNRERRTYAIEEQVSVFCYKYNRFFASLELCNFFNGAV